MRSLLYALGFSLVTLLCVFTSCQKTSLYNPTMTASLDSLPFAANGSGAAYCDTAADTAGMLHIHGNSDIFTPGTAVRPSLLLNVPRRVGTYTIGSGCSATLVSARTGKSSTHAASGSITIVGIRDGRVEGTFSFTCGNGEQIANGQFYTLLPK